MVVLEVSIMGNLPMISCCFCISYLNKLSLVMFFNNEIPIKRNSDYLKLFSKFLNSIPLLPIINHVSWVKYCLFRRSDLKLKILIQIIIFQDLNQFLFFFSTHWCRKRNKPSNFIYNLLLRKMQVTSIHELISYPDLTYRALILPFL